MWKGAYCWFTFFGKFLPKSTHYGRNFLAVSTSNETFFRSKNVVEIWFSMPIKVTYWLQIYLVEYGTPYFLNLYFWDIDFFRHHKSFPILCRVFLKRGNYSRGGIVIQVRMLIKEIRCATDFHWSRRKKCLIIFGQVLEIQAIVIQYKIILKIGFWPNNAFSFLFMQDNNNKYQQDVKFLETRIIWLFWRQRNMWVFNFILHS